MTNDPSDYQDFERFGDWTPSTNMHRSFRREENRRKLKANKVHKLND